MTDEYLVRQYRPAFCTGFTNSVVKVTSRDDILTAPWLENFKHGDFERFEVEPYGNELIINAKYKDGKSWVAGFAVKTTDPFANDWRYKEHES